MSKASIPSIQAYEKVAGMTETNSDFVNEPFDASDFLAKAGQLMAQRGKQYDQPSGERSMAKTCRAFRAITGKDFSEQDGWLLMLLLKQVRQWQTPGKFHRDSAEDGVAYAALLAESLANMES